MEIFTNKGEVCLVSPEDYELANSFTWHLEDGYFRTEKNGKKIRLHRLIMKQIKGTLNSSETVDHINQNKLDNQRPNLRVASVSVNNRNVNKPKGKYTSDYKGVSEIKKNKWKVAINKDGNVWKYAYYNLEHHAAHQYDIWAKELNSDILNNVKDENLLDFKEWTRTKNSNENRNITELNNGEFKVEISRKIRRIYCVFSTLKEAIEFRDTEEEKIRVLELEKRKEKFKKRLETLEIKIDSDIFEKIYMGTIRYRKDLDFVYFTLPGEKEKQLSRFIMDAKFNELVENIDKNRRNLLRTNLIKKTIRKN